MGELDKGEEPGIDLESPRGRHTDPDLPPILNGRRLLPNHLVPGYVLTAGDIDHLRELLDFHYQWLAFYEKFKEQKEREMDDQFLYIRNLQSTIRAPITGYVLQDGRSKGVYGDGWAAPILEVHIRPLKPVEKLLIRGWRPPEAEATRFDAFINFRQCLHTSVGEGNFEVAVDCHEPLEESFTLRIECGQAHLSANSDSNDSRHLGFVLIEIRAEHRLFQEIGARARNNE